MRTYDVVETTPSYAPLWAGKENTKAGTTSPVVHVVGESFLREELRSRLPDLRFEARGAGIGKNATSRQEVDVPSCWVVDLDLFTSDIADVLILLGGKEASPIILIGTCADPRLPVRALKTGAYDFFPKPINPKELIAAITAATEYDRRQMLGRLEEKELRSRLGSLTPREREVLPLVVGGLLNKQAASVLGISEITLQIHRGQVMRKMKAASLADLVRMSVKLRIRHWTPSMAAQCSK